MTLAEKCITARKSLDMSQRAFASKVGTNQTEISFIERGFIPNGDTYQHIEKVYDEVITNESV